MTNGCRTGNNTDDALSGGLDMYYFIPLNLYASTINVCRTGNNT